MKIKIIQKGYELFTGPFGSVEFANGVSIDHVSRREAERLGSILPIVEINDEGEENGPISIGQTDLDNRDKKAEVKAPLETQETTEGDDDAAETKGEAEDSESDGPEQGVENESAERAKIYTEAELEAIADKDGMSGLREIGNKIDAKGNSIDKLIIKILQKQKG